MYLAPMVTPPGTSDGLASKLSEWLSGLKPALVQSWLQARVGFRAIVLPNQLWSNSEQALLLFTPVHETLHLPEIAYSRREIFFFK